MKVKVAEEYNDAVIVGMTKDSQNQPFKEIKDAVKGLYESKEFKGDYGEMKLVTAKAPTRNILLVGLGDEKDLTLEKLRRLSGRASKKMVAEKIKSFTTMLHAASIEDLSKRTQAVTEGAALGLYTFKRYITVDKEKIHAIKEFTVFAKKGDEPVVSKSVKKAMTIAKHVMYVRDLVNEPAEKITPQYLAGEAKKIARDYKNVKVKVFTKKDILRMGMGGLEAVSRGGGHDPMMIVLEYTGGSGNPLTFVGKGITFDSGGINIKPAAYMEDMRSDMTGAATVMSTLKCAAELKLKQNIAVVVPTCENMTGGRAFKQGDIIKAYNGKTIEVWHTDAEGRLILADALSYAEKHLKPKGIIDVATLTGASIVALGYGITSLMSTDEKLKTHLLSASKRAGEMMWELPLYEDYKDLVRGDVGDVRNTAKESPGPGTITAGLFLSNFVEKTPWVHLDIGASSWYEKSKDYNYWGATGVCLRSFIELLEQQ